MNQTRDRRMRSTHPLGLGHPCKYSALLQKDQKIIAIKPVFSTKHSKNVYFFQIKYQNRCFYKPLFKKFQGCFSNR